MCTLCDDFYSFDLDYTEIVNRLDYCNFTIVPGNLNWIPAFCPNIDHEFHADLIDRYVWRGLADELLAKGVISMAQRAQFELDGGLVDAAAVIMLGRLLLGQLGSYFLPVQPGAQTLSLARMVAYAPSFVLANAPMAVGYGRFCNCRDANGARGWFEEGTCYQIVDGAVVPCP